MQRCGQQVRHLQNALEKLRRNAARAGCDAHASTGKAVGAAKTWQTRALEMEAKVLVFYSLFHIVQNAMEALLSHRLTKFEIDIDCQAGYEACTCISTRSWLLSEL